MREFFLKDKKTNVTYRGCHPTTDLDCPPFDYFRLWHAYISANIFQESLKEKCPCPISEDIIRGFVLQKTDESISNMFANSEPNDAIHNLLMVDSLTHKEQNKLLKGLTLTATDILWMNREAQEAGYLLDVYHEEKYPDKFKEKKRPVLIHQKDDGSIEKMGATNMTDGEMRSLLEQRKVVQAYVYHKDSIWHCFYFTYKGLAGRESGLMGSKPHYHYLSDKSGIEWEGMIKRIKNCDMPSSNVHIVIDRYY